MWLLDNTNLISLSGDKTSTYISKQIIDKKRFMGRYGKYEERSNNLLVNKDFKKSSSEELKKEKQREVLPQTNENKQHFSYVGLALILIISVFTTVKVVRRHE